MRSSGERVVPLRARGRLGRESWIEGVTEILEGDPARPGWRERAVEAAVECERLAVSLLRALERLDPEREAPAVGVFRRDGDTWTIEGSGSTTHLRDSPGLRHLAELIRSPGREIAAVELWSRAAGESHPAFRGEPHDLVVVRSHGAAPILDDRARTEFRRRAEDLRDEIAEAEAHHDLGRAARAREELDFLVRELRKATGLHGRSRNHASLAERARVNVTKAIRHAIRRIGREIPTLGAHLEASVLTGSICRYQPVGPSRPM